MNLQALLKKMEAILNDQLKNLIQETTSPLQEQKNQAEIESQLEQNFFSDNDAIKKRKKTSNEYHSMGVKSRNFLTNIA